MYLEFTHTFQEWARRDGRFPLKINFCYIGETPEEKAWEDCFNDPLGLISSAMEIYDCGEIAKYLTEVLISHGFVYFDCKYYDVDMNINGASIIYSQVFNYPSKEISGFMVNDIIKGWLVSYNQPQESPPVRIKVEWTPDEVIVYEN